MFHLPPQEDSRFKEVGQTSKQNEAINKMDALLPACQFSPCFFNRDKGFQRSLKKSEALLKFV